MTSYRQFTQRLDNIRGDLYRAEQALEELAEAIQQTENPLPILRGRGRLLQAL